MCISSRNSRYKVLLFETAKIAETTATTTSNNRFYNPLEGYILSFAPTLTFEKKFLQATTTLL